MAGLPAALWLLGLFAAAPALRTSERYRFPDRLRDALILGVAIPFALGLVHALYPPACWATLAGCIVLAFARDRLAIARARTERRALPPPYVLIGALAAVAWPQLMRPLLDGDSLSYHLPNAAAFVQAHSVWTTATRYWWYPPASELFAGGLYAVGGPFAVPWAGVGALALLGFRVAAWARDAFPAPPLATDALAAAVVTIYPLAIQGSTLQNDVWLAAFWLESLWCARRVADASAVRTLAVTALIKPQGWLLAAIALIARRAPLRLWLVAASGVAIWLLHDAILWRGAAIAPQSTAVASVFASTIVAHGLPALALVARVTLAASPFGLLALCAALAGPLLSRRDPRLGWAAFASALLFLALPFGYATSVAQLATGASLRFAAPAIAIGAVLLAPVARRYAGAATILLLASTLYGVAYVLAIFWNDGGTHVAIAVAVLAVAIAAVARARQVAWLDAVVFGLAVAVAIRLAARHPIDYYADALRVGGEPPGIYRWIATERPRAVGGWGVRLGAVNVLSPGTRTRDLPDDRPCARAREEGVALVAVAQSDLSAMENAARLRTARACGHALYADASGIAVLP